MTRPLVLITEDHPDLKVLLGAILKMAEMDTLVAERGEQALEFMRSHAPDVVLLDMGLAGKLNGIDVLSAIRADPQISETPVVLLTGQNMTAKTPGAEQADLVLQKPVDNDHLVKLVRRLLASKGK